MAKARTCLSDWTTVSRHLCALVSFVSATSDAKLATDRMCRSTWPTSFGRQAP